jgi:hypothetical protein
MAASFDALNASCIKNFGSPVSYQQGAGDPFPISGILQRESDEERHQDGVYARLHRIQFTLGSTTASPALQPR